MLGQVIHGYRIDRALSEDKGGFGDVYFATHVDSGAEAVVKVLKPEMSAMRDIVARFFNEARAAASIHHPGIVQIHNVGYHGERAYLLMERLRGSDLESRLEAGPLPIDRAVLFMRQAAGAVGAAHERGIVHRDLKPANLFVVVDPDVIGGERVRVLDFGIAKLTADSGAGKTQGVFGSPPYMSPEQCASTGAVDARSDLYSLGCIFYELVCGRPPFGHGGIELIASHLRDTPPPPRALAPWVPPAIEQVILGLLEKQPDRRIASCATLIAALDEAARVSGLAGASVPNLPAGGGAVVTARPVASATVPLVHPGHPGTTLGSAASAASTPPGKKRSSGVWLGLAAIVVVGGAVTAVMAVGGRASDGPKSPPQGSGNGSVAVAAPLDAAVTATEPPNAARVADAAVDPSAANGSDGEKPGDGATASQAAIAAKLNEEAKNAIYAGDYEGAIRKLRQAIARAPEVKYFINLCTGLVQAGRLEEALTACKAVEQHHPTSEQQRNVEWLIGTIRQEARKQKIDLHEAPPAVRVQQRRETSVARIPAQQVAPAPARSQSAIAAQLNEEGKALMYRDEPAAAAKKFQEAVARDPNPTYFVNLCTARLQEGKLDEALTACQQVEPNGPNDGQRAKAAKLIGKIEEEARRQGLQLHRGGR